MKRIFVLLTAATWAACSGPVPSKTDKATAIRYFDEVVGQHKLDKLEGIFAPTFLVHNLVDNNDETKTIEMQRKFLGELLTGIPDLTYTVNDVTQQDDRIVLRLTANGTHTGDLWGFKATGNKLNNLSEIFFFRFEDGRIVELWVQLDMLNLLKALQSSGSDFKIPTAASQPPTK
jgi:predicted ester cyclase